MPHTAEEKKRAVTRLRRIRGQVESLERVIEAGADCGPVLQQLAALRGAVNGLMAEVLEGHLREEFSSIQSASVTATKKRSTATQEAKLVEVMSLIRSYLK